MKREKELIKNTFIIFIGKFFTQLISFFLMPLYTYFLSTNDYGYIDLVQSYIVLLIPIIILRMDSGVFRFLIDDRNNINNQKKTISTALEIIIIQTFLFLILYLILKSFFDIVYIDYIFINIVFMSFSQVFLQITRGIGDNLGYSIASIVSGVVNIILNVILIVKLELGGESILISSAFSNLICVIYLIFKNKLYKFVKITNIKDSSNMLKYSLPMIPDGLSWWAVNVSDRSIISIFLGSSFNGIYAISCKFSNILSSIFQIFNMSWQENASLHIRDKDASVYFSNILNNTYKIFFSLCLLIMSSMYFIFLFFIGHDYYDAYMYIPILLLSNVFNSIANVIGGVYIANKKTSTVAKTTIFGAIINILIDLIFIKKCKLFAACLSTLISYIAITVYRYIDVQNQIRIKLEKKLFLQTMAIFVFSFIVYLKKNLILSIITFAIVIFYLIILNKNYLKEIFNVLKGKIKK